MLDFYLEFGEEAKCQMDILYIASVMPGIYFIRWIIHDDDEKVATKLETSVKWFTVASFSFFFQIRSTAVSDWHDSLNLWPKSSLKVSYLCRL